MELHGEQGESLRGKEDSIGSDRGENGLKGFGLIPVT